MKPRTLLLVTLTATGIFLSGIQLLQIFRFNHVTTLARTLTAEQTGLNFWQADNGDSLAKHLYSASAKAETLSWLNPRAALAYGRAALLLASKSVSLEEKAKFICQARSSFIHAAQLAPATAEYQIAWADLDAQLHQPERFCRSEPATANSSKLSASQRLDFALSLSPVSARDGYLASLVYLALGNKNKTLELLRQNQESNPHFLADQRAYAYRLVWTEADLQRALPRKFPDVVTWIEHYRLNKADDYRRWKSSFETGLNIAIDELVERLQQNPAAVESVYSYLSDISTLPLSNASTQIRPKLDRILAKLLAVREQVDPSSPSWSKFLETRANYSRLPVAKAVIADDRNPRGTSLFAWLTDEDTRTGAVDIVGRSLGILIPTGFRARVIMLENNSAGHRLSPEDLELWSSEDNGHFSPITDKADIASFSVDGRQRITIPWHHKSARFIKIRYMGTSQQARFTNTLQQLVQVYGELPTTPAEEPTQQLRGVS